MSLTRRHFIQLLGTACAATAAPLSFSVRANGVTDYKALICVFLKGGNDFFHQVIPTDDWHYSQYALSRQDLAVSQDGLLELDLKDRNGVTFGLHPSLKPLETLFEYGTANFALNVGTLLSPTRKEHLESGRVQLPPYLFAHNKQQEAWQHSWTGQGYSDRGWLGMAMDRLVGKLPGMPASFYAGPNHVLDNHTHGNIFLSKRGFESLKALSNGAMEDSYRAMATKQYPSPLVEAYANVMQETMFAQQKMGPIASAIPFDTRIPDTNLGSQLRSVKQMIDAALTLGHNRQVFYVSMGGFDTHDNQIRRQDELMTEFAEAIAGLYTALGTGLTKKVMTFTLSEFGRSMHGNARQGTDHGWGGGQFFFGGNTRKTLTNLCYGLYPDFTRNSADDNGEGRLIPTLSHEQYAARMVKWFGLSDPAELDAIFPGLRRFGGVMA